MLRLTDHEDDDDIAVPVPLDRATRARLVRLAAATGRRPALLAGLLLRDMLIEDEVVEGLEPPVPVASNLH